CNSSFPYGNITVRVIQTQAPATPTLSSAAPFDCSGLITVSGSGVASGNTITVIADGNTNIGTATASGTTFSFNTSTPLSSCSHSIALPISFNACITYGNITVTVNKTQTLSTPTLSSAAPFDCSGLITVSGSGVASGNTITVIADGNTN